MAKQSIKVPSDEMTTLRALLLRKGASFQSYALRAIREKMERDLTNGGTELRSAVSRLQHQPPDEPPDEAL